MNVTLQRVPAGAQSIAVLSYEARRPRNVAIVAGHGYSSSKQNLDGLCAFLASHGFAVHALDFPGHKLGASGGRLERVTDLFAAMDAVVEFARGQTPSPSAVYVLGHSMGATAALCVAGRDPAIAGAIAIATGYGRPAALDAMAARGVVDLRSSYVDGLTLQAVARDWEPYLQAALPALAGRPVLTVAAERDGMVPPSAVQELFAHLAEPKAFATVASDHTFAGDASRTAVLAWLNERHPRAAA